MGRTLPFAAVVLSACCLAQLGCRSSTKLHHYVDPDRTHYRAVATDIEYPDVESPTRSDILGMPPPRTLSNAMPTEFWDLKLEEALQIALSNSEVMRDVGGRVLAAPQAAQTVYEPAIRETDARLGVEAALAAFDANLNTGIFWSRNERAFNNIIFGGGNLLLVQEAAVFRNELSKRSASGLQMFLRNNVDYDGNNSRFSRFPSAYNMTAEMEIRQPFLQGAGVDFNRIAGPNSLPGVYNGVLLARINTDVSLADFEAGVTNLVRDVERTYWDLYFAYRDLNAKILTRDAALQTWRSVQRRLEVGAFGGDDETEARSREQYYLFVAQVENALTGGSTNLTLGPAPPGVYSQEARLRLLMGLPPNDGRLIRPADEPLAVEFNVDWEHSLAESLVRRVELRRQKWIIKRRELELTASRNFLLPRVDGVALYRWRGFGDELISAADAELHSALENLVQGDLQEWQLGVQAVVPIGARLGHVAVRNAELQLTRDRAVLAEQELLVVHELSDAVAQVDRTYHLSRTAYNRLSAALKQLQAVQLKYENEKVTLDFLLEAQRRSAEAASFYHRTLADYTLAQLNLNLSRGTLLDYNSIYLAEGPWPGRAHLDAARRTLQWKESNLNYCWTTPPPVSLGVYPQDVPPHEPLPSEIVPPPSQSPAAPPEPLPPPASN